MNAREANQKATALRKKFNHGLETLLSNALNIIGKAANKGNLVCQFDMVEDLIGKHVDVQISERLPLANLVQSRLAELGYDVRQSQTKVSAYDCKFIVSWKDIND